MGFLTPVLLAGAALVAIPIALHLVMRRQPRELVFPAIRFVQARREANRRRLQLRHLVLLALRCFLVAGLALALARPTLKGSGLKGKEGAPLAVALVIDNSLRMQYVHQNRSRLERAAEMARELVEKLPEDAQVAVCDLGRAAGGFAPDLSAAASRLRNLRATADARPLAEVVVEGIRLTAEQKDRRQEVFVFTDLTAGAWPKEALTAINDALAAAPDVRIYIVDNGVASPQNAALGAVEIRRSVLRPGEPLHLEASIASNLKGEPPLVELLMAAEDGQLEKRAERIAELDEQGAGRVSFDVADLPLGTHQGTVKLVAADPLAMDNSRNFTVEVRQPARLLLLGEREEDARFFREAVKTHFECTVQTFAAAAELPLDDYQAVLLFDPGALPEDVWSRLADYSASGGGVGIFLGHHSSDLRSSNSVAAGRLLPGKLLRISRDQTYLRPRRLDHPALAGLRNYSESIPWSECRVFTYWQLSESSSDDAYEVAQFANGDPAIIERPAGRGRLLIVTTPFSDPLEPEGRQAWNRLPAAYWPFVGLCDQLASYLAQDADERFDYLAGETARIRLAPRQQVDNYVLRLPDGSADSRVAASGEAELAIGVTDMVGNYRLVTGGRDDRLDRGFSVNVPPELSDLKRVDPAELTEALPKDRVRLASNLDDVEKYVDIGRSGRELYGWAIGLVALVWGAEHLLANRFYGDAKKQKS